MRKRLYLIGMPGCGKTTLGPALASALDLPFADVDQRICEAAGHGIPQIFAEQGEASFRAMEAAALCGLAAEPPCVVATGGGIVLRADNVRAMRDSGLVVWIDRPLEQIIADIRQETRPLLAGDAAQRLSALYVQRKPLYEAAANLRLPNEGPIAAVVAHAEQLLAGYGADPAKQGREER